MAFSKKRARSLDSDEAEEAHPKIEIDLNKEPEDDEEEAHPKKEIDLNKEPEDEDEDKNANQHQEHDHERNFDKEREEQDEIVTASFAISHMAFIRDITQDENQRDVEPETETNEEDDDQEEEEEASSDETDLENKEAKEDQDDVDYQAKEEVDLDKILASVVRRKRTERYEVKEEQKDQDEDDSEQTLSLLCRWEVPANPPGNIIYGGLVEKCSRPFRKQLTESDVSVEEERSSRLALAKSQATKKFLPLLEESKILSGKDGIKVSVYGPDGKVHEMKMWSGEHSFGLTTGWRKFVGDYELREFCDIVTVWMFRHYTTQKICLAIDSKRFVFRKQLSKRISMAAFEDSD